MNRETYDALVASVEKWRKNAQSEPDDALIGTAHCPLCRLFRWKVNPCSGCPVQDASKRLFCYGTPYVRAHNLSGRKSKNNSWREAAQREADFLAALVPAGGPDE